MFAPKPLLIGSMVIAGLIGTITLIDLALAIPFGRQMVFDIIFIISAALVLYLGFDSYRELN